MAGLKPNLFNTTTPTGTTELYTQTNGINGKFTLDDVKSLFGLNYKEFVAKVYQTGTDLPVVDLIIQNDLDPLITYTFNIDDVGEYRLVFDDSMTDQAGQEVFPRSTMVLFQQEPRTLNPCIVTVEAEGGNKIAFQTRNSSFAFADNLLQGVLYVKIYY